MTMPSTTTPTTSIGLVAAQITLLVNQKANFLARFIWNVDGVPQPLTGYSAALGIGLRPGRESLFVVSTETGEITLDPDGLTGVIEVDILPSNTAKLIRSLYYYDLVLTDPSGRHTRLFQGQVQVNLGITDA